MSGYYKLIIEALRKEGFLYVRNGKGSHEVWAKGSTSSLVPFNCPSRHTANDILKAAGVKHRF